MKRALMRQSVAQLRELFTQSKPDESVLKQLENELQCRQVPRAVALLAEVQAALQRRSETTKAAAAPSRTAVLEHGPVVVAQQSELWGSLSAVTVVASPISVLIPTPKPKDPAFRAKPEILAPVMLLDEAYEVCKATYTTPWESIEQMRRTFVMRSHPARLKPLNAANRTLALAESKRFNVAYATLSQVRCGGR